MLEAEPNRVEYVIADADIDILENRPENAVKKLNDRLGISPGNHPLTMSYARALIHNEEPHVAEEILLEQSIAKSTDPGLWYLLAEVQGLAGNIIGLHQSRAEFFILNGNFDEAEKQINYALELSKSNYRKSEILYQRLKEILEIRDKLSY